MSVLNPAAGESFRVTITKALVANPSLTWDNNYELATDDGAQDVGSLNQAATALLGMERALHLAGVRFLQYRVSTYTADDSQPYDPGSFITVPLDASTIGGRSSAGDPMSLNNCFYVQRVVPSGRQGKLLYRGVLGETDCVSPAGVLTLVAPAAMSTLLQTAITTSNADELFASGTYGMTLVMISGAGPGTSTRDVTSLNVGGASVVKFNHRYFNRPNA